MHLFRLKLKRTLFIALLFSFLSSASLAQPTLQQSDALLLQQVQRHISLHPLATADVSSPRATLTSFLTYTNMAYRLLSIAEKNMQDNPGLFKSPKTQRIEKYIYYYLKRSGQCLNLTKIPPNIIKQVKSEKILLLKEVLDRVRLPALKNIPDNATGNPVTTWTIPHTNITIQQVTEGPNKNNFLFSARSMNNIRNYYRRIKQTPYYKGNIISRNFYQGFTSTAGDIIPPKWSSFTPAWASIEFLDQTLWQWLSAILTILTTAYTIYFLWNVTLAKLQRHPTRKHLYLALTTFFSFLILEASFYVIAQSINITGEILHFCDFIFTILSTSNLAFFSFYLMRSFVTPLNKHDTKLHIKTSSIIHHLTIILGIFSFIAITTYGLHNLGAPIFSLLTGLGVGGLALALAMRSTLGDFLGAFTIFIDKPYSTGDFIKIRTYQGTVEHIGLRSTQIRLVGGTLISLPNETASGTEVENMTQRKGRRESLEVSLPTSSSPQQIEQAIKLIQQAFLFPNEKNHTSDTNKTIDENQNEATPLPAITPLIGISRLSDRSIIINIDYTFPSKNFALFNQHLFYINQRIFNDLYEQGIKVGI